MACSNVECNNTSCVEHRKVQELADERLELLKHQEEEIARLRNRLLEKGNEAERLQFNLDTILNGLRQAGFECVDGAYISSVYKVVKMAQAQHDRARLAESMLEEWMNANIKPLEAKGPTVLVVSADIHPAMLAEMMRSLEVRGIQACFIFLPTHVTLQGMPAGEALKLLEQHMKVVRGMLS